jgi:hypothetical protein
VYLPARAWYFGCRSCHRLTYWSTQQRRTRAEFLWGHPRVMDQMLDGPGPASWNELL